MDNVVEVKRCSEQYSHCKINQQSYAIRRSNYPVLFTCAKYCFGTNVKNNNCINQSFHFIFNKPKNPCALKNKYLSSALTSHNCESRQLKLWRMALYYFKKFWIQNEPNPIIFRYRPYIKLLQFQILSFIDAVNFTRLRQISELRFDYIPHKPYSTIDFAECV